MTNFEKIKQQTKSILKAQLYKNKKSNVFFCNLMGGVFETKENIILATKVLNKKVTFDYVRMLAEIK